MLPINDNELEINSRNDDDVLALNIKTHKLNYKEAVISGYSKDKDALIQSVFFMLTTERYKFPIYSNNYGLMIYDLLGQPMSLVKSELKRRITDCLLTDDRITKVDDFVFTRNNRALFVTFTVYTVFTGSFTYRMGVDV